MKKINKMFLIFVFVAFNSFICFGCHMQNNQNTREYVDDYGVTVKLPDKINRIAVSGPIAQFAIMTLCPNKLCELAEGIDNYAMPYVPKHLVDLTTEKKIYGKLYNNKGDVFNKEKIATLNPDVIIDIGSKKKKGNTSDPLSEVRKALNPIPIVFIDISTAINGDIIESNFASSYQKLGSIFGVTARATKLSDYCKETIEYANKIRDINRTSLKNVFIAYGNGKGTNDNDFWYTDSAGSLQADVIDMIANNIITTQSTNGAAGSSEINQEALLKLLNGSDESGKEIDLVICYAKGTISDSNNSITVQTAFNNYCNAMNIQNKKVYAIPYKPFGFLNDPPCENKLLGIYWLSTYCYQENANIENAITYTKKYNSANDMLIAKTKEFFQLFYNYTIKDNEINDILLLNQNIVT